MKRIKWSILLFVLLAIGLSIGVTYLAFNQKVTEKKEEADTQIAGTQTETHKMTIALVNEDQGATYQGETINFGAEFVKSIEKDNENEWFVVSRGVAESGLKRDIYNMEIIIPSDFSEKALSLTSDNPEKITVSYKVNDVGNDELKAEAEKTAGQVLEDMNKRVIDVYFASILTNLQEAQDNIGQLVEKEEAYTDRFDETVNSPLSNYTDQFQTVQDYTGTSKESFKSFQDMLNDYEKSLQESGKQSETYDKSLEELLAMQDEHAPFGESLSDNLTKFSADLSADTVMSETQALEQANQLFSSEFQAIEGENSLLTQTQGLQNYIADINSRVTGVDEELQTVLDSELEQAVAADLKRILQGDADNPAQFTLNELDTGINDRFKQTIADTIQTLPDFDSGVLENWGLSAETLHTYENVTNLSQDFVSQEAEYFPEGYAFPNREQQISADDPSLPINQLMAETTDKLKKEATTLTSDPFTVPASENDTTVYITLDSRFSLQDADINVYRQPYAGSSSYNTPVGVNIQPYDGGMKITIPASYTKEPCNFQVRANVLLNGDVDTIPLFGSIDWGVYYQQTEKVDAYVANGSQPVPSTDDDATDDTADTAGEEGTDDSKDVQAASDATENSVESNSEEQTADEEKPAESTTKQSTVTGIYTFQTLTNGLEPVAVSVTQPNYLSNEAAYGEAYMDTFKGYEELAALYQLYYGIVASSNEPMPYNLDQAATADSYYGILNNKDVLDSIVSLTSQDITDEYSRKLSDFQDRIQAYQMTMREADQRSLDVTRRLTDATAEAASQNENLAALLAELEAWRDSSLDLIEEDDVVVQNAQDEQTLAMDLDSSFGDLLMTSQSLAEESASNLDSAEGVYETFDAIDQEAQDIEKSGQDLVSEASNLSTDLAKKLKDDGTFEDNFSQVMDNSRVGDRQNETLYDFLSSPVQKVNAGTIVATDKSTPYFMVLICTVVALFTSYVIAHQEKKRRQTDAFAEEMSLASKNLPITFMTFGIALIEGLLIGVITAKLFSIGQIGVILWIGIILIIMFFLVGLFTYLLRQLNMGGMFIILTIVSMYLFLTDAVGLTIDNESIFGTLKTFSPLQYIEQLLVSVLGAEQDFSIIVYALIGAVVLLVVLNLFVWHREKEAEEEPHEA
ncbi:type VII secretion protein EsaA [Listeria costaricensis]|uniref:type VII secretion protein EsaA n=1 Tax=Listeria costaricensis TaxID=2026604 RepID=UPI000C079AA4|nr:type VII secretion protein EsaA [Listeria costaricensis]